MMMASRIDDPLIDLAPKKRQLLRMRDLVAAGEKDESAVIRLTPVDKLLHLPTLELPARTGALGDAERDVARRREWFPLGMQ